MRDYTELSKLLGICILVSNHKEAMKLVKSMKNLLPYLKYTKISMCINGKDYELDANLNELLKSIPEELEYAYVGPIPYKEVKEKYFSHPENPEDSAFQFLKLRQLSTKYVEDRKYWFIMDDDMVFGGPTEKNPANAGLMLLRMIEYMERMPKCGVISGGSTLIRRLKPHEISISLKPGYMARGIFVRNVDCKVCRDEFMNLAGGAEDDVLWYDKISLGYYPAVMPSFKVTHHANIPKPFEGEEITEGWHRESVRRHPIYGGETLLEKYFGVIQHFNTDTLEGWHRWMENHLKEKIPGAYEFNPEYTLDLSYVE